MIAVHYYHSDKEYADISQIVTSVQWTGENATIHRTAEITLQNTANFKNRHVTIEEGKWVIFSFKGKEMLRGMIIATNMNSQGIASFTVVDNAWYLVKNSDVRIYRSKRADQIVRETCISFGINIGSLANTGFVLSKMAYPEGESLRNIFIQAITETSRKNKRKFSFKSVKGKLSLYERKTQITQWNIEDGITLTEASTSRSIEELYNSVKIIANTQDGAQVIGKFKNGSSISKYGLMQTVETYEGDNPTTSALNAQASTLVGLKSGVVKTLTTGSVIGQATAISGSSIYCYNKLTGLIGGYYIVNDSHMFDSNGNHSMSLTLSTTNDLPKMDYTPPQETK